LTTASIIVEILIGLLKFLNGLCTDLTVDSGSKIKYSLLSLLQPKIQISTGIHSGSVIISGVLWVTS